MGKWEPSRSFYETLMATDSSDADISQPYPFCLAHPLEGGPGPLGSAHDWLVEWKWDGIRAQLIRREGQTFLWTRGEELVTDRYPEIEALGSDLSDGTVIDGEILPWKNGAVLPFAVLQRRIGRKTVSKKLLAEVPVVLLAFDLLEVQGEDVRSHPLEWRRARLATIGADRAGPGARDLACTSRAAHGTTWLRSVPTVGERGVEGLMLKRMGSPYHVGRVRGDWWKWKIAPLTIDAVLVAAQRGSGKRASLYTDYTFGVWNGDRLVTIAKAYSGLTDAEIQRVDSFVRRNTRDRFGPVRTVAPELVFELAFEGIQRLDPTQVGRRRAVPTDQSMAPGQNRRPGRHARITPGPDRPAREYRSLIKRLSLVRSELHNNREPIPSYNESAPERSGRRSTSDCRWCPGTDAIAGFRSRSPGACPYRQAPRRGR